MLVYYNKPMKLDLKIDYLFVKFILVGILNTLFGYAIFAVLLFAGLHYSLAVVLATIAGVLFNFKTTGVLVFKNHNNLLIFKFVAMYAFTSAISIGLLRIAEMYKLNLYFAGLVTTGMMAVVSFFISKYRVFKQSYIDSETSSE